METTLNWLQPHRKCGKASPIRKSEIVRYLWRAQLILIEQGDKERHNAMVLGEVNAPHANATSLFLRSRQHDRPLPLLPILKRPYFQAPLMGIEYLKKKSLENNRFSGYRTEAKKPDVLSGFFNASFFAASVPYSAFCHVLKQPDCNGRVLLYGVARLFFLFQLRHQFPDVLQFQ